MKRTAKELASFGRHGDTELLHVSKKELNALRGIGSLTGRRVTTNPRTGLPEAFSFGDMDMTSLLPALVGIGGTVLTGGAMAPLTAGMLSGALTTAATGGDLQRGLMAGLSGGMMAGLGQGLVGMGQGAATAGAGVGAEAGSGMIGAGLDGAAGDTAATYATQAGGDAVNAGVMSGMDGAASDLAMQPNAIGAGLDGAAGDAAGTFATNPNRFSMSTFADNVTNPSAWSEQFLGDKFLSRTVPGMLALGTTLDSAYQPKIDAPGSSEQDKRSAEFASKEKRMERDYTPAADPMYALTGSGEPQYFSAPRYNFAEGGIVTLPNGQQADNGIVKAVRAIRSRYRSKQQAVDDMKVRGSFIQRLGITNPDDPIMQYAFGYTKGQGKKKGPQERMISPLDQQLPPGYAGGGHVRGPGDGMSDSVPAKINGRKPAKLANDEYVFPADAVSGLGNGSSSAGAQQLDNMVARIRAARTGTTQQAPAIDPRKVMPK